VNKLPSPAEAQRYRAPLLYTGPQDDEVSKAIQNCDPEGPLTVFVSKFINIDERFIAFGRVFSGTVHSSQKVKIMGANYSPEGSEKPYIKNVQQVCTIMGGKIAQMGAIPCGNTVGLVGIDQYLIKQGTVTSLDVEHPLKAMKFSVSPIVRVAVKAAKASDLPKLVKGLRALSHADPLVQVIYEETGEHIIAGAGELHVQICCNDLENLYAQVPLIKSEPVVSYKETVTAESS